MPLRVQGQLFPGGIEMRVFANAGKNIQDLAPGGRGILHAVGGKQRQLCSAGQVNQWLVRPLFSADQMPLNFYENVLSPKRIDQKLRAIRRSPGTARILRAPFGILPDGFLRQDAANSTLEACAPQAKKRDQSLSELRELIPLHRTLSFFAAQMRPG